MIPGLRTLEGTADPLVIGVGVIPGILPSIVSNIGTILAGEIRFYDHHSPSVTISSHEAYGFQTDPVSVKTDTVFL